MKNTKTTGRFIVPGLVNTGKTTNAISTALMIADEYCATGQKTNPSIFIYSNELPEDILARMVENITFANNIGHHKSFSLRLDSRFNTPEGYSQELGFKSLMDEVQKTRYDILVVDQPEFWDPEAYGEMLNSLEEKVDALIVTKQLFRTAKEKVSNT